MLPHLGDLMQIELGKVLRCVENLVAFRIRLKHSVLDAVVDHLHIMSAAWRTDVRVTVLWCEGAENRLAGFHGVIGSADHQAVAVLQAPDASARPGIDERDATRQQLGSATLR